MHKKTSRGGRNDRQSLLKGQSVNDVGYLKGVAALGSLRYPERFRFELPGIALHASFSHEEVFHNLTLALLPKEIVSISEKLPQWQKTEFLELVMISQQYHDADDAPKWGALRFALPGLAGDARPGREILPKLCWVMFFNAAAISSILPVLTYACERVQLAQALAVAEEALIQLHHPFVTQAAEISRLKTQASKHYATAMAQALRLNETTIDTIESARPAKPFLMVREWFAIGQLLAGPCYWRAGDKYRFSVQTVVVMDVASFYVLAFATLKKEPSPLTFADLQTVLIKAFAKQRPKRGVFLSKAAWKSTGQMLVDPDLCVRADWMTSVGFEFTEMAMAEVGLLRAHVEAESLRFEGGKSAKV
jgi:hypothetical protein